MWKKLSSFFPRYVEEFQLNERQRGATMGSSIITLIENLYSFSGTDQKIEADVVQAKLEALKTHFDLKKIDVLGILGEDDCKAVNSKVSEKYLGYEDYLVEKEFWSDKQVATLAKMLANESEEISPKDLNTIRRLVENIHSPTEKEGIAAENSNFDPYVFFNLSMNQKVFIHSLLLKRHKFKGTTVELSNSSFRLLLNSFQFICLSRLISHETS